MKLLACAVPLLLNSVLAAGQKAIIVNSGAGELEMMISGTGSPAIVLESGFSDTYEYWEPVAAELSKKNRVVRYNRAGFGHSPLNDKPRTAEEIATELHTALHKAGVAPPYILVGHSAGGLYVREFAHLFTRDVAGMVLIDPAPERFYDMLAEEDPELWKSLLDALKTWPSGAKAQFDANATTVDQVSHAWPQPRVPITLVIATKPEPPVFTPERRKQVTALEQTLARKLKAKQITADGCGHNIPGDCPAIVTKTVMEVVSAARHRLRQVDRRTGHGF